MMQDNDRVRGMTMVEVLTVLVIISVLAAIVYPTILKMRFQVRTAKCVSQLKDIGTALMLFKTDHGEYPNWLSNLCPEYIHQVDQGDATTQQKPLVCPCDFANPPGSEGRLSKTITGIDPYLELNDTEQETESGQPVFVGKGRWTQDQQKVSPLSVRNTDIKYCSYSYEFGIPECSYWNGGTYPDQLGNRDGVVSWREVKTFVERDGYVDAQGNVDPRQAFDGKVPIVRCFWHIAPGSEISMLRSDPRNIVWNLRSGDMSVSRSDPTRDGWQKD